MVSRLAAGHDLDLAGSTISAGLLQAILVGAVAEIPPHRQRIVISNGAITGKLDLTHARPPSGVDAPLRMLEAHRIRFEHAPKMCDARLGGLRLLECELPGLQAERLQVIGDLVLDGSWFSRAVRLPRLTVSGVISATRTIVKADLDLRQASATRIELKGASIDGEVDLASCSIDGDIQFDGAHIGDGHEALDISACHVRGLISMSTYDNSRFESFGMIDAIGASLGHGLEICGARLRRGSSAYALDLARLDTDGCLFLRDEQKQPLECDGTIDLSGARIGAYSRILSVRLNPTVGFGDPITANKDHPANGVCIDFSGARIENFLEIDDIKDLTGEAPPDGKFRLVGTYIGLLDDTPLTAWPRRPHLDLTGLTYDLLSFEASRSERLQWLMLQFSIPPAATPTQLLAQQLGELRDNYRWWLGTLGLKRDEREAARKARRDERDLLSRQYSPQPFEQLAGVLRKMGYEEEADHVAVLKREMRTQCRAEAPWRRLLSVFMDLTSRYGYSPKRATAALAMYWLLGVVVLGLALATGAAKLLPTDGNPQEVAYILGPFRTALMEGCRGAVTPLFVLDTLIPGVDLGQTEACNIDTDGLWGGVKGFVFAGYQLMGNILAAITFTTFAGLLRKD